MKKILLAGAALAALSMSAQAADLGSRRTPIAASVYTPVMNSWNAIYGGLEIGGIFGNRYSNSITGDAGLNSSSGFLVGGRVGADFQSGSWVFGGVADLAYTTTGQTVGANTAYMPMLGSARLRAGYLFTPDMLGYVTGGLAFGTTRIVTGGLDTAATSVGWTAGLGLEYKVAQNWSTFAEYRYHDLGQATLTGIAGTYNTTGHEIRVGLNYRFSTGGGAVSAKY